MDHYLRNSAHYIMDTGNFRNYTSKELSIYKRDYKLFLSIVEYIGKLDDKQKKSFLEQMKSHYDKDEIKPKKNHIQIMYDILSTL